jgi:archaellum biogenesis protein FlaJ (TadC family)
MKYFFLLYNTYEYCSEYSNFLRVLNFLFLIIYFVCLSTDDESINIILRLLSSYERPKYDHPGNNIATAVPQFTTVAVILFTVSAQW